MSHSTSISVGPTYQPLTIESLDDAQIGQQITEAYDRAMSHAQGSVLSVIEAGTMLLQQKERLKKGGHWLEWLHQNCPTISDATAERMRRAATHYHEHGGEIKAQSIRQLYIEAKIIKDESDESIRAEPPIYAPLQKLGDACKLKFSDEALDKMPLLGLPKLMDYVDSAVQELVQLKERLAKRLA